MEAITSELKTVYEPDLDWNKNLPEEERLKVTIDWPTIEQSALLSMAGSHQAIAFAYAKTCIAEIQNGKAIGLDKVKTGKDLMQVKSKGQRKAWQLALHVGSYIFNESFLSEDDEIN